MRRPRTITALALLLAAAATHPAVAGSTSTYTGECHMAVVNDPTGVVIGGGTMVFYGAMWANVSFSSPTATDNPVSAVVTCWVQFPGAPPVYGSSTTGTASVQYWQLVSFVAVPGSTVWVCTEVDFLDNTPTATSCITANSIAQPQTGVTVYAG